MGSGEDHDNEKILYKENFPFESLLTVAKSRIMSISGEIWFRNNIPLSEKHWQVCPTAGRIIYDDAVRNILHYRDSSAPK